MSVDTAKLRIYSDPNVISAADELDELRKERVASLNALGALPEFSLVEQCQKRQAQLNDTRAHVAALEDGAMGSTVYLGQIERELEDTKARLQSAEDTMRTMVQARPAAALDAYQAYLARYPREGVGRE